MYLVYLDESGNSGTNLSDPQQPVFVLGALVVPEEKWMLLERAITSRINRYFNGETPSDFEIHATDIRNGTRHFRGVQVEKRLELRDDLLALASKFELKLIYRGIAKKRYAAWLEKTFGVGIVINPHIAAFPLVARAVNHYLVTRGEGALGILINDENKDVVVDLERTTRLLRADRGTLQLDRIIEKSFFISSAKSVLLQLADLCIFYARKLEEIKAGRLGKRIDEDGIKQIEELIYRSDESFTDVIVWLTTQNKRSGEDPSGAGSPLGGRARR